jgi:glycosyltransferase involved in cell wall biosynthesis
LQATHHAGAAFVYWLQDFYSLAASRLLAGKFGGLGTLVGAYYRRLERGQLQRSDGIVLITEDFRKIAGEWAGDSRKLTTIENWGPLSDIALPGRQNPWAIEHGLTDKFVFLYSGTLALKHDPELLIRLARYWQSEPAVRIVVIGAGVGVERLRDVTLRDGLANLILLPLQPMARLSEALASADVLVAVVEEDAGAFSVPSKVQAYLCAERPILLSAPPDNLASKVVSRIIAGVVTQPGDYASFTRASRTLFDDPSLRALLARNGRIHAEQAFDIERIADRFEAVFGDAVQRASQRPASSLL